MENAILTFTYGLTLGVTGIITLQFILDEYFSLKKQKSWPTAKSTQGEDLQKDEVQEEKNQKDELGPIILHAEESGYNPDEKFLDHQYKDLIIK